MFRSHKDINRTAKCNKPTYDDVEVYQCDICDDGWESETDTYLHREEHWKVFRKWLQKPNNNVCMICIKKHRDRKQLLSHIKSSHLLSSPDAQHIQREIYVCDICTQIFFNKNMLIVHFARIHWRPVKKYTCKWLREDKLSLASRRLKIKLHFNNQINRRQYTKKIKDASTQYEPEINKEKWERGDITMDCKMEEGTENEAESSKTQREKELTRNKKANTLQSEAEIIEQGEKGNQSTECKKEIKSEEESNKQNEKDYKLSAMQNLLKSPGIALKPISEEKNGPLLFTELESPETNAKNSTSAIKYSSPAMKYFSTSFQCPHCDILVRFRSMWGHMRCHAMLSVSACKICYGKSKNTKELEKHILTHPSYYHCDRCNLDLKNEPSFSKHLKLHEQLCSKYESDEETLADLKMEKMSEKHKVSRWKFPKLKLFGGLRLYGHVYVCILCRCICVNEMEKRRHAASHFLYLNPKSETKEVGNHEVCICGEVFKSNIFKKQHLLFHKDHKIKKKVVEEIKIKAEASDEESHSSENHKSIKDLVPDIQSVVDRIFV